ncbi:hypothetical protein Tco_0800342 [Tanacetum coccineum]|uniref:Uncharacterized protein n=1 Tax=Tanacetum coccineum TaxID=301880 RepID=A0ABQ4ZSV1_9ASTR
MSVPVTAEEKTNKKNDVKAKSLLLMALPNEHQLTFSYASSSESLDSIFNRLQKIVSRLAILGVSIAQEDLNSKFLNSLPLEWNTHVKSVGASGGAQNLAFITASTTSGTNDLNSSTNDLNTVIPAYEVSTASPNVNAASLQVSTASFIIHEDDLEAMDLKWQLSLLSMRVKRVCRVPRNKEGQFRNQDNNRKQGNNEDTSSKAMLAIDGVGFDWSHMAEEQVLLNSKEPEFSLRKNYDGLLWLLWFDWRSTSFRRWLHRWSADGPTTLTSVGTVDMAPLEHRLTGGWLSLVDDWQATWHHSSGDT